MFDLLKVGTVAALVQVAVCLVALTIVSLVDAPVPSGLPVATTSKWGFLIIAIGLSLTTSRFLTYTAARMNWASAKSGVPLTPLISTLGVAAVGFFVLALRSPPEFFQSTAVSLIGTSAGSLLWPALMSIGLAAFGSSAHAAVIAAQWPS
jgi:hypothetical protein